MRKVFLVLLFVLMCGVANAALVGPYVYDMYSTNILAVPQAQANLYLNVSTRDIVYSRSFDTQGIEYFAVEYQASSTAVTAAIGINLQVDIEQGYNQPTTECGPDSTWTIPTGSSAVDSGVTTNGTWYIKSYSLTPMPFARFKVSGLSTNKEGSRIRIKTSTMNQR